MIEKWKSYCGGSELLAWLTLTEAGVWLAVALTSLLGRLFHFHIPIAEWLTLPSAFPIFITRPWTIITYMGVHFEVLHMLFNVLWLYWFGRILLLTLGGRHLGLGFFGGGIAGGLLFMLSSTLGYGGGWLCGCSAAVIAVMCLAALRMPDHPVNLFLIGEVKLKWVAVACCVLTFIGGGGNQSAHAGGLLWGVAMGLMLRNGIDLTKYINLPKTGSGYSNRSAERMARALRQRQEDTQRLDRILDKIKLSGYGSLSRKERKELNELSQRIKNQQ